MPTPAALRAAHLRHQRGMNQGAPVASEGITIAGELIANASVSLGNVAEEDGSGGTVERRALIATFDKSLLTGEPVIGSIVTYMGKNYDLDEFWGREEYKTSWKIRAIEKDRP